jgi:hypothetical protein
MQPQIEALKKHIREIASDESFVHHKWFVKWHLEIVERLALELCEHYPQVNRDLITVMAWMHDYGKILDFDNQYAVTLVAGREKLVELGFSSEFAGSVIANIELLDKKETVDLRAAPIEVQIVSSADGCSHMVGPFMYLFWHEATDQLFAGKTLEELMQLDIKKAEKDWNRKIVLPEARTAFQKYFEVISVQCGKFPDKFFV